MSQHQLFQVSQKAFIEKDGAVLVMHNPTVGFEFPGGRLEQGESDIQASLLREIREETDLTIEIGRPLITWMSALKRQNAQAAQPVFIIGYQCRYLGGEIVLSSEHDAFRWVSKDKVAQFRDDSNLFTVLETYFRLCN